MAGRSCLPSSWIFVTWLLVSVIQGSQKPVGQLHRANDVYVSSGLVFKAFLSRKASLSRKYDNATRVPPSWKCLVGLKLGNITICAACLVLLAGDVAKNPGPVCGEQNNGATVGVDSGDYFKIQ